MNHAEGGRSLVAADAHLHLHPYRRRSPWHRRYYPRRVRKVSVDVDLISANLECQIC